MLIPAVSNPRTIIQIAKAIVRDSQLRRGAMFWLTLGSLVLLFLGATVLDAPLQSRPILFILWWLACGWLMCASVLLAAFDMLAIRAAGRKARRDLVKRMLDAEHDDENTR